MSYAPLQFLPPEEVSDPVPASLSWTIRLLSLVATVSAVYLTYQSMQSDSIPGCSAGSVIDCSHVITSRWSYWLEIPVGVLGGATYASIFAVSICLANQVSAILRRAAIRVVLVLSLLAGGGALWFIGLQFVAIGKICSFCMVAHACGLVIAALVSVYAFRHIRPRAQFLLACAIALTGIGGLVAGQVLFPHQTFIVESYDDSNSTLEGDSASDLLSSPMDHTAPHDATTSTNDTPDSTAVTAAGQNAESTVDIRDVDESSGVTAQDNTKRLVRYFATQESINIYDYPHLGDPSAEHVVVELMDYTCHHCRAMYPILEAARKEYGSSVVVVLRPIANSKECNTFIEETHPDHEMACDLVKTSLAVWFASPENFAEYHHWLMSSRTAPRTEIAIRYAETLVGKRTLERGREDHRIASIMRNNHRVWHEIGGTLPLLFVAKRKMQGVPGTEREFMKVMGDLIGPPTAVKSSTQTE